MIAGLLLAAGASLRYGSPKQLELQDGESWVRRTARLALAAGCGRVIVVVGASASEVQAGVRGMEAVETIVHPEWGQGIGSSIAAGIRALLDDQETEAVLLLTCDQVHLDHVVLGRLIEAYDATPLRTVASAYAGTIGVPAIFERGWFGRLARLSGDRGAKSLLLGAADRRIEVDWPAGAEDRDRKRERGG